MVGRVAQLIVDDVAVEIELAGVFRLEGTGFQVNYDEGPQSQVVKQQVDIKLRIVYLDPVLPPDENETLSEFEQEFLQVTD